MSENQTTVQPSGKDSGSQPLLALKGFTKSFGAVEALKDVIDDGYQTAADVCVEDVAAICTELGIS